MKFNCDRCKTRYSISDDRVRGKILKIRCKNCSAVITVREGMTIAAPKVPAPARRAPAPAPKPPPPPPPTPRPMVVEWFLSIDGDQTGPYDLERAKRWVSEQPSSAELYCWSEGFDDWLPVEKVSHFRGLRRTSGLLGRDPHEKTPAPLFADAMRQMTAEAPTLLEDENPFSAAYERKKRDTASQRHDEPEPAPEPEGFMLPIGQPSSPPPRRQASDPGPLLAPIGEEMPQISGLTMPEMPRPEVLQPARRRSIAVPLIAAAVVILVILGVLLYLALRGGDDSSQGVTRSSSRSASLARSVDEPEQPAKLAAPDAGPAAPSRRPAPRRAAAAESSKPVVEPVSSTYTAPSGEVDLSAVGGSTEEVKQGTLDPDDVATVYRKRQFSVNRCYEHAIKRDPLLEVPKTYVTLEVAGSGRVTRVSIPSLANNALGSCLVASISRWTFPRSTEGFAGRFPIVFRSR